MKTLSVRLVFCFFLSSMFMASPSSADVISPFEYKEIPSYSDYWLRGGMDLPLGIEEARQCLDAGIRKHGLLQNTTLAQKGKRKVFGFITLRKKRPPLSLRGSKNFSYHLTTLGPQHSYARFYVYGSLSAEPFKRNLSSILKCANNANMEENPTQIFQLDDFSHSIQIEVDEMDAVNCISGKGLFNEFEVGSNFVLLNYRGFGSTAVKREPNFVVFRDQGKVFFSTQRWNLLKKRYDGGSKEDVERFAERMLPCFLNEPWSR